MTRPSQICQLASDFRGHMPADGLLYQEKVDGFRAVYIRDWKGRPGLYTRNGMKIEGAGHIIYRLQQMEEAAGCPMFWDGEFQVDGTLAATKRWCESGWKAGGEAGQMFLFDCLPYSEWEMGGGATPLIDRLNQLRTLADTATDDWTWRPGSHGRDDALPPVVVLEDGWAFDHADVVTEARRVWSRGGEGIMCKFAEAPYQRSRSAAWQKVKRCNSHKWMKAAA